MRLEKEDNIRLILLAVFSLVFLTIWNVIFKPNTVVENKIVQTAKNTETLLQLNSINDVTMQKSNFIHHIDFGNFAFDAEIFNNRLVIKSINYNTGKKTALMQNKDKLTFGFNTENGLQNQSIDWATKSICNEKVCELTGKLAGKEVASYKISKTDDNRVTIETNLDKKTQNSGVFYVFTENSMKEFTKIALQEKDAIRRVEKKNIEKNNIQLDNLNWFGLESKYFSIVFKAKNSFLNTDACANSAQNCNIINDQSNLRFGTFYNSTASRLNSSIDIFILPNAISTLETYENKYNLVKLDKLADLGLFAFIIKPTLLIMNKVYDLFGNYTVAILFVTALFKLISIPLITKSYASMKKMKSVAPQIEALKLKYKDDSTLVNTKTMEIYRENGINPLSSILPMLIQIPFFFALYKVFSGSFELYGAKGFLWIKDLSETEGLSILNLFGLIPFNVPDFLKIGPMSLLMGLTMFVQQKTSPSSSTPGKAKSEMEEAQETAMKIMPLFLTFVSSSFPAGLLLYWILSNLISIIHQVIYKRYF